MNDASSDTKKLHGVGDVLWLTGTAHEILLVAVGWSFVLAHGRARVARAPQRVVGP